MSTTKNVPKAQIITEWLPVTTEWPAVKGCTDMNVYQVFGNGTTIIVAFDPEVGISLTKGLTCLPEEATISWNQTTEEPRFTVTSLGPIICPELYSTAVSSVVSSGLTSVLCCPSNYTATYTAGMSVCGSSLSKGQNITAWVGQPSDYLSTVASSLYNETHLLDPFLNAATTISDDPGRIWDLYEAEIETAQPIFAFPVEGYDFRVKPKKHLSVGAKAGIGLAVALFVCILLLAGGALFLRRKRMQKKRANVSDSEGSTRGVGTDGEGDVQVPPTPPMVEARGSDGVAYKEMGSPATVVPGTPQLKGEYKRHLAEVEAGSGIGSDGRAGGEPQTPMAELGQREEISVVHELGDGRHTGFTANGFPEDRKVGEICAYTT
ncbi:hypothetical protein BJ875DRAFT_267019 [Amylocarpus encephaloides]|uniref:Uncharacterized protein n=1 Tax=Amylocarpus encephaloides TaxID=45428 RepID=A0A9P7YKS3_9HELO|nr:hypothetical protein BJ875DRAFT_267019 [Amylocarpus encephaloides]